MKKVFAILVFLTITAVSFGQDNSTANNDTVEVLNTTETVMDVKAEQPAPLKKVQVSAKVKAKVLKINRKKSNDIISIKAYRKSLQIKVKTVKLC